MVRTVAIIALLATSFAAVAQSSKDTPVTRLINRGKDGNLIYYTVRCRNDTVASVTANDNDGRICAQGLGKEKLCRTNWSIYGAAKSACR